MGARSSQSRGPGLNKSDGHLLEYFRNTFVEGGGGTNSSGASEGLTATGGVISDYTDPSPGKIYRAHIFTTSGTFDVSEIGTFPAEVEYLVVGGGGAGGNGSNSGGGGGAGGFRTNVPGTPGNHTSTAPFTVSTSPGSYTVTIGAGGNATGADGSNSVFGTITSTGGGGGGGTADPGSGGGSGGGGGTNADSTAYPGGATSPVTTPSPWPGPATQGTAGGSGTHVPGSWEGGGGGGGAGAVGQDASQTPTPTAGAGGIGIRSLIAGPNYPIGAPGPGGGTGWFAGGGGGQGNSSATGGAWNGSSLQPGGPFAGAGGGGSPGGHGVQATGGGGGGGGSSTTIGRGGSGFVAVRYQIGTVDTGDAKASGGAISFYNNKTIHTFTSTGPFQTPASFSETCEYVVVGGGGGAFTGGGGAGGYRTGTTPIGSSVNYTITVGAGADARSPIGSPSSIGTIPIAIPGGGSSLSGPDGGAQPGASGGGGVQGGGGSTGASSTGDPYPGSIGATPTNGWGHDGGNGQPADKTGGGGGGAGGAGDPNSTGGTGIQLPTTFRDPSGFQYDNHPDHPFRPSATAGWFVAGGGAGTVYTPFPQASPPLGPTPYSATATGVGGVGGGGCRNPADPRYPVYGFNGMTNTGGGAAGGTPVTPLGGARGGSGLVLIAYPT